MDHLLILPIHSFLMLLIKLSCLLLQLSYKTSSQALFPDNAYGVDSGGDPKVIPNLTFEEFKVYSLLHFDFIFFWFMLVWGFFNLNVVLVIFLRLCLSDGRNFTVNITTPAMPGYGSMETMIQMNAYAS